MHQQVRFAYHSTKKVFLLAKFKAEKVFKSSNGYRELHTPSLHIDSVDFYFSFCKYKIGNWLFSRSEFFCKAQFNLNTNKDTDFLKSKQPWCDVQLSSALADGVIKHPTCNERSYTKNNRKLKIPGHGWHQGNLKKDISTIC